MKEGEKLLSSRFFSKFPLSYSTSKRLSSQTIQTKDRNRYDSEYHTKWRIVKYKERRMNRYPLVS